VEKTVIEVQDSTARRVIAVLCHTDTCCPTISFESTAQADQQVVIADDFGQEVRMSREQFQVFIDLAQQGRLAL
jgi:hypothetical protein